MNVAAFVALLLIAYVAFLNACNNRGKIFSWGKHNHPYEHLGGTDDREEDRPDSAAIEVANLVQSAPKNQPLTCETRLRFGGLDNPDGPTLQRAAWDLWTADKNRAEENKNFTFNCTSRAQNPRPVTPRKQTPLFKWVNPNLQRIDTYRTLWDLLSVYALNESWCNRNLIPKHILESDSTADHWKHQFFIAVTKTEPYKVLKNFLANHGCTFAQDDDVFNGIMWTLWFAESKPKEAPDVKPMSYFEHHFFGRRLPIVAGFPPRMIGLHNWVGIYFKELHGVLYFAGFKRRTYKLLPTLRIYMDGAWKEPSLFMGPTPEFEITLVSLMYFARNKMAARFFLRDCTPTSITAEDIERGGLRMLGGGFPRLFVPRNEEQCPDYINESMNANKAASVRLVYT